ncbi:hypothetical protein VPH35_118106 [Triticum aestivum]|uniref:Anaphase-promoting complex subunit 10 n=1 Tax=Aegilops tauschii TaxID=37682 RepID=M8B4Q7_AEGTA
MRVPADSSASSRSALAAARPLPRRRTPQLTRIAMPARQEIAPASARSPLPGYPGMFPLCISSIDQFSMHIFHCQLSCSIDALRRDMVVIVAAEGPGFVAGGIQLVVIYVDFKLDKSYTPSKISIGAGDGFHNLKRIIHSHIYAPNRGVGQSPEREGHPCPTDQDMRAMTVLAVQVFILILSISSGNSRRSWTCGYRILVWRFFT